MKREFFKADKFGRMVHAHRINLGLSLRDLSAEIGIDISTISRIERGKGCMVEAYLRMMTWLLSPVPQVATCPKCDGKGTIEVRL